MNPSDLTLMLRMADVHAGEREYDWALHWLDAAASGPVQLPVEYNVKRLAWKTILTAADTGRFEPRSARPPAIA